MKKLLCLTLCFVMALTMLVSCGDQVIGDGIGDYPSEANTDERLDLNMYIVTGDATTEDAARSVSTRISGHTKVTYNTTINITYVKASEYDAVVTEAINNGGAKAPHIVLINSKSLFDTLHSQNKLADLTKYYKSVEYKTEGFGKLNTQIAEPLLKMSEIDGKYFTVPNNRVLGEYEYLVINKDVAHKEIGGEYGRSDVIAEYKSLDDAKNLMNLMDAAGYNSADLVKIVKGPYELREELSKENFCNVISVPTVTEEDAFASAFAITANSDHKYVDRAMKIVYAINNDTELRNFLQYGVKGANYDVVDGDIRRILTGENAYEMNLDYTGDVLKAAYCKELGWTEAKKEYGKLQINDAVVETKNDGEDITE